MPNHTTCVLEVTGDEEVIMKMMDFVKNGEQIFSLNSIIPMPEALDITAGSNSDRNLEAYMWSIGEKEKVKNTFELSNGEDVEKIAENYFKDCDLKIGKQLYENVKQYGYSNWYDWRNAIWGTKWEAYEVSDEWYDYGNAKCVGFETAWSPPVKVIEELSRKFPTLKFKLKFVDEGCMFVGYVILHNGKLEEDIVLENDDLNTEEGRQLIEELDFSSYVFLDEDEESHI